jgi:molybdenum cofactor cytidylyltransferase
MGRSKALLPVGDETLIHRVVRNLVEAGIESITVVTGHEPKQVTEALSDLDVTFTHNSNYDAGGMLSSIQTGIRALSDDADSALIVLGDQPLVEPDTIRRILEVFKSQRSPLVVPSYQGKRGHPVLLTRSIAAEALALGPADTLKTLVRRYEETLLELPVNDPYTTTDVDTPEDYRRLTASTPLAKGPDHV